MTDNSFAIFLAIILALIFEDPIKQFIGSDENTDFMGDSYFCQPVKKPEPIIEGFFY